MCITVVCNHCGDTTYYYCQLKDTLHNETLIYKPCYSCTLD